MLFCLVHAAWHDEACWQPLVAELGHRGHECVVPVLPLDDNRASFDDYAQLVAPRSRDRPPRRSAAALRAEHKSLRLPDAMSLATAIMTDSTLLTLDKKMRKIALRAEPRAH